MTMTSVLGHLSNLDFEQRYRNWRAVNPRELFEANTVEVIDSVRTLFKHTGRPCTLTSSRTSKVSRKISNAKLNIPRFYSYGQTAIAKGNISGSRSANRRERANQVSK